MAFTLPTFILTCNIWRSTNPTSNPPDVTSVCNLALGRRNVLNSDGGTGSYVPDCSMYLLLPALTDIQGGQQTGADDMVEVPALSGRMYRCLWVDDAGKGFTNEHRVAIIQPVPPWPTPIP